MKDNKEAAKKCPQEYKCERANNLGPPIPAKPLRKGQCSEVDNCHRSWREGTSKMFSHWGESRSLRDSNQGL